MDFVEFFRKHLSFRGRASRSTYWKYQLFDTFVTPLLVIGIVFLDLAMSPAENKDIHPLTIFLVAAIVILATVSMTALTVRRLHDLEMPGWYYWLLMVPFYGVYLSILLGFKVGSDGPNRYGPDPRAPKLARTEFRAHPVPSG